MKVRWQQLIALLIVVSGGLAAFVIINSPPQTDRKEDILKLPTVYVTTVKTERLRMNVRSQGRVMAQTEIDLITSVSGNIIKVSPDFVSGGFFQKGDLLVSIDPAEYDLRVVQAQARVMEAKYQLTREEAEASQARDEWQHLGQGDPSPLSLRIPQLKERKAKLAAEQEELKNAKLMRQRTNIRAPFNGRVLSKQVGLGQYLSSGTILGRIYSSDLVEVRLPLNTRKLAFIDLPDQPNRAKSVQGASVKLTANYLGQQRTWLGHLVRSEGVIDQDTGMLVVVAQIPDPFNLNANKPGSSSTELPLVSLPIGLFVEASIGGRWFDELVVLPASTLLKDSRIAIIDEENRLRFRTVEVMRRERGRVIISAGLNAGERVLISGLHHPVDGMQVSPRNFIPTDERVSQREAMKDRHIQE